jgi:hypothetical protein
MSDPGEAPGCCCGSVRHTQTASTRTDQTQMRHARAKEFDWSKGLACRHFTMLLKVGKKLG